MLIYFLKVFSGYAIIKALIFSVLPSYAINKPVIDKKVDFRNMVLIPQGCFQMGSDKKYSDEDEQPLHTVCLKSYYIDKYEVTQKEYIKIMGKNPSVFKGSNLPVEDVTWYEANKYCRILGKRLPTEAEFEYAARGGATTIYYWGDKIGKNNANCDGCGNTFDGKGPSPVGSFQHNGFGVYDILGNVWEWTNDWYAENYYGKSPKNNPKGPNGKSEKKVLRGGSWDSFPESLRSSYRYAHYPSVRYDSGFRCSK